MEPRGDEHALAPPPPSPPPTALHGLRLFHYLVPRSAPPLLPPSPPPPPFFPPPPPPHRPQSPLTLRSPLLPSPGHRAPASESLRGRGRDRRPPRAHVAARSQRPSSSSSPRHASDSPPPSNGRRGRRGGGRRRVAAGIRQQPNPAGMRMPGMGQMGVGAGGLAPRRRCRGTSW